MEDPKLAKTALIVLGMHRSGTSALAGVVGHLGAALPQDLMAGTEMNAKGFFESNRIMKLNDRLLDAAGTTWWDPRRFPDGWLDGDEAEQFLADAVDTLALDYGEAPVFVMKDPRVCRLMPFWQKALSRFGARSLIIHTHRPPLDVAPSLTRWTGYDAQYGLLLWERHILDAEADSRGLPRAFTCYESLLTDWRSEMIRIAQLLDFAWPCPLETVEPVVDDFLSRDLQHFHDRGQNRSAGDLPPLLTQTLAIVDRWARDGEAREDYATLDRMRAALDQVGPLYDTLARRSVLRAQEVTSLQRKLEDLEGKLEDLGGQLGRSRAEFDDLHARHSDLMERNETAAQQLKKFADQQAQEQAERQELSVAMNDPTVTTLRIADLIGRVREASAISLEERARADVLSAELALTVRAREGLIADTSRLSAELARLEADLEAARQAERQLRAERDDLAVNCQRMTTERDQAREETSRCEAAFLSSTSWRVTAPLRLVSRLVGRGRRAS